MTNPQPAEDGNLPAALKALHDAVHLLIEPRATLHEGAVINGPSLYLQLWDAVDGESTNGGGAGGGAKSRPPFWIDAWDLKNEIDQTLEAWQPAFTGVPATVGRLRCFVQRKWRPQDAKQMEGAAAVVAAWTNQVDELLNPKPKWTLAAACPACGTKTVYRKDSAGESVRQPALQIGPTGCTCISCRYVWDPSRFQILAGALGYPLPPGVLE